MHRRESVDHEPGKVKQEVVNFRADQDWFAAFFNECCIADPNASVPTPVIKGVFETWYRDNHGRLPPTTQLWKALSERGFEADRGTAGNYRLRHGLKMIPQSRAYQKFEKAEAQAGVPPVKGSGPVPGWT